MGNYFSEMNCMKATVITETNDEAKKDENISEQVKEPNPICDIEDCCKNKDSCNNKDCCKNKDSCNKEDCSRVEECCDKK